MISQNITTRTTFSAPDGSDNNRNNNNGDLLWRGFGAERRSKMATGARNGGDLCARGIPVDYGTLENVPVCLIKKKTYTGCRRWPHKKWYSRYPGWVYTERCYAHLRTNDTLWVQHSNYVSIRKAYVIGMIPNLCI